MAKCKMCGAPMDFGVCKYCGSKEETDVNEVGGSDTWTSAPQSNAQPFQDTNRDEDTSEKNRIIALLLAFFSGPFGFHNFYVGRIGRGILYIFTAGFFFVGYIYDLVMIIMGKFKDGERNYIK